ncbi:MAG: patatin-like phospholipase family protein [Thermodesulfobacteriota bacterium]
MKKAIALGGGGAKGYAHLGVLKALKELDIHFDIVTGTSIGSFVGAVYAGGGIEKLEEISLKINIADLPRILTPAFSKHGLLSGNYINQLLQKVITQEKIEELPIKYAAVSVDINKGETVSFTKGNLGMAIRSSIAVPGLFTPVIDGDRFLVDGGVMEPVPVNSARKLGADFVVAVDLISKFKTFSEEAGTKGILDDLPFKTEIDHLGNYIKKLGETLYLFEKDKKLFNDKTVVDIVQRISVISQSRMIENQIQLGNPEIVITPDVTEIGVLDFHKSKEGIEAGYKATKEKLPEIKELLKIC